MRRLIYVPIIHTEVDMGSMSNSLKERYIQKYGENKWFDHLNKTEEIWIEIEKRLDNLNLCYKDVRVYQDGLPNCGIEEYIVRDIAKKGSRNYQLILKLLNKGARLIGTEDPQLLVAEYKNIRDTLSQTETQKGDKGLVEEYKRRAKEYLFERDRYISHRIDETLKEDETGILFIGMMHKVDELLPEDIKKEILIHDVAGYD